MDRPGDSTDPRLTAWTIYGRGNFHTVTSQVGRVGVLRNNEGAH